MELITWKINQLLLLLLLLNKYLFNSYDYIIFFIIKTCENRENREKRENRENLSSIKSGQQCSVNET